VPYYTPYLLSGMVLWQCVVATTNESCQMFLAQGIVRQVPLPYSVHAYRLICRNFLVMGHSAVVVVAALLVFRVPVDWHILLVVPGLLALAINGLWLGTILGMVSARFGDIPPIAASFLQVAFFVTPIFWSADRLGTWQTVAQCNPYFAFIDSIRAPLLGMPIQPYSWLVIALTTLIGGSVSFLFFARFRTRIPYWL
jgi:ABC-2 type transport system permease protein/lipopolysaccharide transport system permease protein